MIKLNKKVIKYSAASVVWTVVFVLLVLAINLIAGTLTEKFNLYVDLTSEELFAISEKTDTLLANNDKSVEIIFFKPLDKLDSNKYIKSVKTMALEYSEKYDNITVKYVDLLGDPSLTRNFKSEYSLNEYSVIVSCTETGKFAGFDVTDCFITDSDSGEILAFDAEYRFTSAILKATRESESIVTFITNHGEDTPQKFKELFEEAGFKVTTIDLLREEIDPLCEILISVAPTKDFDVSGGSGRGEITKLTEYLQSGKDAMIFMNPDTPELKNLDEFLLTWGLIVKHGYVVHDDINYYGQTYALYAGYDTTESKISVLTNSISDESTPVLVKYASPIEIGNIAGTEKTASPLIISYSSAYVPGESNSDGGIQTLVAASCRREYDSENGETLNYLLVSGSTEIISDYSLETQAGVFANSKLFRNIVSKLTNEKMAVDVDYKKYNDTSLVTNAQQRRNAAISMIAVLPMIVLAIAFVVYLRRRHL